MTPERWKRIEDLYNRAAAQEPGEREGFLAEACGGDEDLRREVESLLSNAEQGDGFLERPALEVAARRYGSTVMVDLTGRKLGRYDVLSRVGRGGMGEVYRARDTRLQRQVALKVLPPERLADPERKRRFEQEARAASALDHPNIVTIHDIDQVEGIEFIAMEYVEGQTLAERIGRKGLPVAEALGYAVQIADALVAAHRAGIVHRDIKPANVMVTEQGGVKVLDFGLAKLTEPIMGEEAPTETAKGTIVGTVAYMSPEQAQGKPLDARSDIFSFGALLYEMVSGQRAFQGDSKLSTLAAIIHKEPGPLSADMPHDLAKLVARCLRKDPERRFQLMKDLRVELADLKEESDSGELGTPVPGRRKRLPRWLAVAAGVVLLAATVGVTWWLVRSPRPAQAPVLTRLTSDSGLTTDPALSPDGKLLAYASDRSGEDNLDIWVRQVPGGEPIRITRHEADDSEPTFSPDGTKIAFRSLRDGGGIYVVAALGGDARLIARQGRRPKFSPDGREIAFWVGEEHPIAGGQIFVMASTGGSPRRLAPDFAPASHPIWSPDGKHLLFRGATRQRLDPTEDTLDWWVTPLDSGVPVKTGASAVFRHHGLTGYDIPLPGAWAPQGDRIIVSAGLGDSTNLWQIPISAKTWKVTGTPQRLTSGTGMETQPSLGPGGQLAFSSLNLNIDVWSLPIDANQGKVVGELQRLTHDAAADLRPTVSADGKTIAFQSSRSGNWDIWMKDLENGRETALTATPSDEDYPKITRDGLKVAYGAIENQKRSIHVIATGRGPKGAAPPGVADRVCEDCGIPRGWSSDGAMIHYWPTLAPSRVDLLVVSSGEKIRLLEDPKRSLLSPEFSPDDRWITFHRSEGALVRRILIVPFRRPPPDENEWVAITDGSGLDREPCWSPDGTLLYYLSEREGFRCVWAQHLNPATKRPVGAAFPVYHFHRARLSLMSIADTSGVGLSVARDKLVFSMGERTGNIWMSEFR